MHIHVVANGVFCSLQLSDIPLYLCTVCCAVFSRSVVSNSLWLYGRQPTRLLCPWGFSRQEKGSGLPCPPSGDLTNLGMELRSPALQQDFFYHLSHQGSPRILNWVAYPFSMETSQLRNWTEVSCISGGLFTSWTTQETPYMYYIFFIHSPVEGHIGCFHILVIVNSATINTRVCVSFGIMIFSRYMLRSGISGSHGSYIFVL